MSDIDFGNFYFNVLTSLEPTSLSDKDEKLVILKDCNPIERWESWKNYFPEGRLPGSESLGCGINSLVFLNEMSFSKSVGEINKLQETKGTTMQQIIDLLNSKKQKSLDNKIVKNLLFKEKNFNFIVKNEFNEIDEEETRKQIYKIYKAIFDEMEDNSCTIIQLKGTIISRHTIIITKKYNRLFTIDPQQSRGPRELKINEWKEMGKVSDGTYNTLIKKWSYKSLSVIIAIPLLEKKGGKLNTFQKLKSRKNLKIKKRKTRKQTKYPVYGKEDFESGDGMLTSVWGPSLWHYLHTMSFNYPVNPSLKDKKYYKNFILNLQNVLPCRYCRENLKNNLKQHPLQLSDMKNRETFSRWIYELHELINKMLGKKSNLSYEDVQQRYEHFRARCSNNSKTKKNTKNKTKMKKETKKEKGCTNPLYGRKTKCVIKIVPQDKKCDTFQFYNK